MATIGGYFRFYSAERPSRSLGDRTPAEVFASVPVRVTQRDMVESLRTADPKNNMTTIRS